MPKSVRDWSQHTNLHSGILLETVTRRLYVPDTDASHIHPKRNVIKLISIRDGALEFQALHW